MPDLGPLTGRYRDVTPIGGTGPVLYTAVHAGLGHPVLMKVMPRHGGGTSAQAALFLRGARAAARLDHPHIVRVYDLVSTPAADILVQELVDGPTLDEELRARPDQRLPAERAFAVAAGLADALVVAHAAGLVHRNLNPSAVHLTRGGAVKLAGFEAALVPTAPGEAADSSEADRQLGNPLYVSPEQARGDVPTARSDLYSLGALLYQMLAGRPPITGTNAAAVQYKKQTGDPLPLARSRPDLPPGADELVRRLLARNPSDRPRDMAEARDALRRFSAPAPAAESDRRDVVLLEYPTPVAQAYARVWREWDWGLRHAGLLELMEVAVKYCAVATVLAASDARGEAPPPRLQKLPKPAFGNWLHYLRDAVGLARGTSPFVDRMRDSLFVPRPGGGRIADLLNDAVAARNAGVHGRRRQGPNDEAPFRDLLADTHEVLAALRWLTEFPLIQVHEVDFLDRDPHPHLIRYRRYAGLVPSADSGNQIQLAKGVGKNRLGILHAAGRAFLDLAPFVRYARCPVCAEDDLFVYNGMPSEWRVVLMGCHGPHELEEVTAGDPFAGRGIEWSH